MKDESSIGSILAKSRQADEALITDLRAQLKKAEEERDSAHVWLKDVVPKLDSRIKECDELRKLVEKAKNVFNAWHPETMKPVEEAVAISNDFIEAVAAWEARK